VATSDVSSATVSVFLGNGDGTFQPKQDYPAGSGAYALAVADLNGDGIPDVVVTNPSLNGSVNVLLGNGDGSFQAPVSYPAGSYFQTVAVADLTGTGVQDIIAGDYVDNRVKVLLGNGNGTFQAAVSYTVGPTPRSLAVADVHGDGIPDLLVGAEGTSPYYSNGQVDVLLGKGDGTFQPPVAYADPYGPLSLTVADFNGDSIPDLVTANLTGGTATALLGQGDGSFRAAQPYAVGNDPLSVAVADFNRDGLPDVVTANSQSNNVAVLLNLGDWPAHRSPVSPQTPRRPPAADQPALAAVVIDRTALSEPLLPLAPAGFRSVAVGEQPPEAAALDEVFAAAPLGTRPSDVVRSGPAGVPKTGLEDPLGVASLGSAWA
jgi:hypothetical protein